MSRVVQYLPKGNVFGCGCTIYRMAALGPGEDLGAWRSNFRQLAAIRRKMRGRHTWESGASHVSKYLDQYLSR
jgi:hypothetical protein